jgi:hypothetical protein
MISQAQMNTRAVLLNMPPATRISAPGTYRLALFLPEAAPLRIR